MVSRPGSVSRGNERILGGSDFVRDVLAAVHEELDRRYQYKILGYDLKMWLRKSPGYMG
jgi:hypothetical protein